MVSQLSNFSVLFLFISLSCGQNSEPSYLQQNAPPSQFRQMMPAMTPEWEMLRYMHMLHSAARARSTLQHMLSEIQQFNEFRNMKAASPISNPWKEWPVQKEKPEVVVKEHHKHPVYIQMFEIPKSYFDNKNNTTKAEMKPKEQEKSQTPIPLEKVEDQGTKNETITEDRIFVETITKPEVREYKYIMDLPIPKNERNEINKSN